MGLTTIATELDVLAAELRVSSEESLQARFARVAIEYLDNVAEQLKQFIESEGDFDVEITRKRGARQLEVTSTAQEDLFKQDRVQLPGYTVTLQMDLDPGEVVWVQWGDRRANGEIDAMRNQPSDVAKEIKRDLL